MLMATAALAILATVACSGNASDSATGSAVRSYSYGASEPTQQSEGGETELPEPAADAIHDFDINFYQGQDIVGGDVVPVSWPARAADSAQFLGRTLSSLPSGDAGVSEFCRRIRRPGIGGRRGSGPDFQFVKPG